MKLNIFELNREQLANLLAPLGKRGRSDIRAAIIFKHVYAQLRPLTSATLGISREIQESLKMLVHSLPPVKVHSWQKSSHDGSIKFIMELDDGKWIESVLIPERGRLTLCISTQVGCAQACRFCQTGRMGLLRQLTTAEIVGQLMAAEEWRMKEASGDASHLVSLKRVSNIVFMGMGEPLDNVDSVLNSCRIFMDNQGLNLSPNKITISTVGLVPALKRVLSESRVSIALSLHSPFDEERSRIMPVNQRHPVAEVVEVLREATARAQRSSFMVQYTLIRGINDSQAHAEEIAKLLHGVSAKVNLIPLNEHEGAAFRRPDLGRVYQFQQSLKEKGLVATVRLSKGRDIQAACGQLIKSAAEA